MFVVLKYLPLIYFRNIDLLVSTTPQCTPSLVLERLLLCTTRRFSGSILLQDFFVISALDVAHYFFDYVDDNNSFAVGGNIKDVIPPLEQISGKIQIKINPDKCHMILFHKISRRFYILTKPSQIQEADFVCFTLLSISDQFGFEYRFKQKYWSF